MAVAQEPRLGTDEYASRNMSQSGMQSGMTSSIQSHSDHTSRFSGRSSFGRLKIRFSEFGTISDESLDNYRHRAFGAAHKYYLEDRGKNWSKRREAVAFALENLFVEILLALVISMNAVLVIMETDMTARNEEVPSWLKGVSVCILIAFTVELLGRIYIAQEFFCYSPSNVFDLIVVVTDVASEILSHVFAIEVSFLRIFRLCRLLRFVAVLTMFKDLRHLVTLMVKSIWTLIWGVFLLIFLLLCWSILAVQFLHPLLRDLAETGKLNGCDGCENSFESVGTAALTFGSQLVFGDNWGTPTITLIEHYPASAIILVGAGATTLLGLMNIILTVIVDKAHAEHEEQAARVLQLKEDMFIKAKANLKNICAGLDGDRDGEITLNELVRGFDENPEFAMIMSRLDITRDDVPHVFSMLDDDASGSVSYVEFVDQLHKMRAADLRTLLLFVKGNVTDMRHKFSRQFLGLRDVVGQIAQDISRICSPMPNHKTELESQISKVTTSGASSFNIDEKPQVQDICCDEARRCRVDSSKCTGASTSVQQREVQRKKLRPQTPREEKPHEASSNRRYSGRYSGICASVNDWTCLQMAMREEIQILGTVLAKRIEQQLLNKTLFCPPPQKNIAN